MEVEINNPISVILNQLSDLKKRMSDMESVALKHVSEKSNEPSSNLSESLSSDDLSKMGEDVAAEVIKLKENGVNIHYLTKKAKKNSALKYKIRGHRGLGAKPITEQEIIDVQGISKSGHEAARKLGVSYGTYKKYAKKYNRHTLINFPPPKGVAPVGIKFTVDPNKGKYPIDDVLQCKWPNFPIHRLKDKLIRSGKKEACCELCGFKERRLTDGKIPLLLNMIDGNKVNHKLENLQILCYNCTFLLGGYIKRGKKSFDPDVLQDSKDILPARF
jgi:hypothetical protein